jgi:hypothetical protein
VNIHVATEWVIIHDGDEWYQFDEANDMLAFLLDDTDNIAAAQDITREAFALMAYKCAARNAKRQQHDDWDSYSGGVLFE